MQDELDLRQAAAELRRIAERVIGDTAAGDQGSWLDQVEAGEWDRRLSQDDQGALADRLRLAADHLRQARALAGQVEADLGHQRARPHPHAGSDLQDLLATRLPLNRKERYYTGSVLPGLIAGNGLGHLHRFLTLCGLDVAVQAQGQWPLEGSQRVQVFTEYNFAESLRPRDAERFPNAPHGGDTPDVVICGDDWLLAVEAKVYHRPSLAALNQQMNKQKALVDYWQQMFGLEPERVRHVLLLPEQLRRARPGLSWPTVTWQGVEQAYGVAGDGYWLGVLRAALQDYEALTAPEPTFGIYADDKVAGEYLARGHAAEAGFGWVGRRGGLHGQGLAQDLQTGQWLTRHYEVRCEPPPPGNDNWMTLEQFKGAVAAASTAPEVLPDR